MKFITTAALLILLIFAGCTGPRVYHNPRHSFGAARSIAVLPFENLSGAEGAGEIVQKIFLVELLRNKTLNVIEPGEVDQALKELRIRATQKLSSDQSLKLKERLKVDWILLGSVLEFSEQKQGQREVPVVSLTARVIEAETGKIVWAAFESRQGDDREVIFGIGKVNSAATLAEKVAQKIVPTLSEKK